MTLNTPKTPALETRLYRHMQDGGFIAADTDTGLIAYAYPTSDHAEAAKTDAKAIANKMLDAIEYTLNYGQSQLVKQARKHMWERLKAEDDRLMAALYA